MILRDMALLKDDAKFSMPPFAAWFYGPKAIRAILAATIFKSEGQKKRWRLFATGANAQPAFVLYRADDIHGPYQAFVEFGNHSYQVSISRANCRCDDFQCSDACDLLWFSVANTWMMTGVMFGRRYRLFLLTIIALHVMILSAKSLLARSFPGKLTSVYRRERVSDFRHFFNPLRILH